MNRGEEHKEERDVGNKSERQVIWKKKPGAVGQVESLCAPTSKKGGGGEQLSDRDTRKQLSSKKQRRTTLSEVSRTRFANSGTPEKRNKNLDCSCKT